MSRRVYEVPVGEFYTDWLNKPSTVRYYSAWWDDSIYVVNIRPCLLKHNLYRITLSNGQDKVVHHTAILFIEAY